jgi:WD40 repeat protein
MRASAAEVRSIAVSPQGKQIAAGLRYGTIIVWETTAWNEQHRFQASEGDVWSVVFSPDGHTLASSDGDWNRGGLVRLWDTSSGRPTRRFRHTGEVLSLTFSPDGRWIAAGAADKTVKVWDASASVRAIAPK